MRITLSRRILFLAFGCAICAVPVFGQTRPVNPNDAMSADKPAPNSKSVFDGLRSEEMHVRRTIKLAEKQYQENLDKAREAAKLCADLKETFVTAKVFLLPDRKKLEKVEKLTRRVRSEAGGSDCEMALEHSPKDLEAALTRLVELSEQMRKEVEKTPRHVVSTAVIDRANRLLVVIQYTRSFSQ